MSSRQPRIGDIWCRNRTSRIRPMRHYLIVDIETEGFDGLYRFLVLETGNYDTAYLAHFDAYCSYIC